MLLIVYFLLLILVFSQLPYWAAARVAERADISKRWAVIFVHPAGFFIGIWLFAFTPWRPASHQKGIDSSRRLFYWAAAVQTSFCIWLAYDGWFNPQSDAQDVEFNQLGLLIVLPAAIGSIVLPRLLNRYLETPWNHQPPN